MIQILKISVLMFFILMMNTTLSAQDSKTSQDKSNVTHEIGINATFFIQQFISLGTSNNIDISPYAITYRRIKSNRRIFRVGLGLSARNTQADNDGNQNISNFFIANIRLGIERQFDLGKRWSTSLGGDLRSRFQYAKTTSPQFQGDFSAIDESYTNGIGPVLGIRFNINQRIGLYTETAFITALTYNESTTEFSQNNRNVTTGTVISADFSLPTSIYFTIKL